MDNKYCSKCGRKLIDNHCPVHIIDMEPLSIEDTITLPLRDIVEMDKKIYELKEQLNVAREHYRF